MEIKKPKQWKYKSGAKKGKLRPASRKYLSFKLKDYHKRQRIIKAQTILKPITYFMNFEIKKTKGYVQGYLSSNKKIPREKMIDLIKDNLPKGYTPRNFMLASEETETNERLLVLFREEDEIFSQNV